MMLGHWQSHAGSVCLLSPSPRPGRSYNMLRRQRLWGVAPVRGNAKTAVMLGNFLKSLVRIYIIAFSNIHFVDPFTFIFKLFFGFLWNMFQAELQPFLRWVLQAVRGARPQVNPKSCLILHPHESTLTDYFCLKRRIIQTWFFSISLSCGWVWTRAEVGPLPQWAISSACDYPRWMVFVPLIRGRKMLNNIQPNKSKQALAKIAIWFQFFLQIGSSTLGPVELSWARWRTWPALGQTWLRFHLRQRVEMSKNMAKWVWICQNPKWAQVLYLLFWGWETPPNYCCLFQRLFKCDEYTFQVTNFIRFSFLGGWSWAYC